MFEIFLVSWGMVVLLINVPSRTAFAVSHGVLILCFNFHLCLGISLLPLWFLEWSIGRLLSYCLASICLKFLQFFSLFLFYYLFICGCSGSSLLHGLFSSWVSGGCSLVVIHGLLTMVVLCCRARALGYVGCSSCGTRAQWLPVGSAMQAQVVVALSLIYYRARGISLDQGSNPCLLYWQVDSLLLSYREAHVAYFWSHRVVTEKDAWYDSNCLQFTEIHLMVQNVINPSMWSIPACENVSYTLEKNVYSATFRWNDYTHTHIYM